MDRATAKPQPQPKPNSKPKPKRKAAAAASEPACIERALRGGRYVRLLQDQLDRLHALPMHGNRLVGLDHIVVAHLLAFFNPTIGGLRSIEDIFEFPEARKRFGTSRLAKSTLSDAQRVFDPELLLPLIDSLQQRAGIQPHDQRLDELTRKLVAVDGTFFTVAARIAWAVFNGSGKGNVRAHVQFDVRKGLPDLVRLTDGQATETEQLKKSLKPGCLYVMDRGFHHYQLIKDIIDADSDLVLRLRSSAACQTLQERQLSAADLEAGVVSDRVVAVGWRSDQTVELPELRCVEVAIRDREGDKKNAEGEAEEEHTLRLLTNRMDLPAWLIALLYRHRWQVELFFRWLKCMAHFNHFFSESQDGMTLQVYIAMIGTLLIAIENGSRPSKYDYALMAAAVSGLAGLDTVLEVGKRRRLERQRAAARDRERRARKKLG
jgi:transposase